MCYEHTCLDAKKAQLWMYLLINTISEWPPNLFKHVWMDGLDSLIAQPGPQWSITLPTLVHCSTNHMLFAHNLMERSLHAT